MKRTILCSIVGLLMMQTIASAQSEEGINIFGYAQGQFEQSKVYGIAANSYNTFGLQQMNMLFEKDLSQSFSSFVNLQFTGNFASNKSWGTFDVEEAWVKYHGSEYLNIKGGLLVPTFNNFNEIKTKTPLLPYIMRPLVYESPLADLISATNFIPERAFLQVYGAVPFGSLKCDYAVYVGNDDPDFISGVSRVTSLSGQDTSSFKMIGGRVGIRAGNLKLGVSGTHDRTNPGSPFALPLFFQGTPVSAVASMLGPVVRTRVGVDASYQVAGFSLEAEYIGVMHSPTDHQKAILSALPRMTGGALYDNLDKEFYYGTIVYDFNEQYYAYVSYSRIQDNFNVVFHSGMNNYTFGGGFRPLNSVVVKAQYGRYDMVDRALFDFAMDRLSVAVSVFF